MRVKGAAVLPRHGLEPTKQKPCGDDRPSGPWWRPLGDRAVPTEIVEQERGSACTRAESGEANFQSEEPSSFGSSVTVCIAFRSYYGPGIRYAGIDHLVAESIDARGHRYLLEFSRCQDA